MSKKIREPFAELAQNEEEAALFSEYGRSFQEHIRLPAYDQKRMEKCFSEAFLWYREQGISTQEAMRRMDPAHLGGFYVRPGDRWFPLDEAEVIYPINLTGSGPHLFRLAMLMDHEVAPSLLKVALAFVIKRFPTFATVVRRGFFWHYLDTIKRFYEAEEETGRPLRPRWIGSSAMPSFRVMYSGNRISLECFHVLTDGAGGEVFLKTLVAEYLRLRGENIPAEEGVLDPDDTPSPSEMNNAFRDTGVKGGSLVQKRAAQMSGKISDTLPSRLLHLEIPTDRLLEEAHRNGVTVTAFLSVLIYRAVQASTESAEGICRIQIPVNMRKYQEGIPTLRNDSMFGSIGFEMRREETDEKLFLEAGEQLKETSSRENTEMQMADAVRTKHGVRLIPLFLKGPIERAIYRTVGIGAYTTALSNLGVVRMPEQMARHVLRAEFMLGACRKNRAVCALASAGNRSVLSITESTLDPSFSETLYRQLTRYGLEPEVTGSVTYEN